MDAVTAIGECGGVAARKEVLATVKRGELEIAGLEVERQVGTTTATALSAGLASQTLDRPDTRAAAARELTTR